MSEVAVAMPVPLPDARRGTSARQGASVGRAAIVMPVLAILAKLIATLQKTRSDGFLYSRG